MADVQAMFHQAHVSDKHVNFICFFSWPHGDTAQSPVKYCIKVLQILL